MARVRAAGMRVAAATLALTLVAAIAEVGLRLAGYDPLDDVTGARHQFVRLSSDRDLQYELVPGAEKPGRRFRISINQHGFRDRDYPPEKPAGTTRIVVIGDSITFAASHAAEERYTEQLEARFAEAGRPVEVLNLGVGGYDVINEVAFLEHVGLRFDPDLVILAWCINDLGIHSLNLRTLRFLDQYGWLTRRLRLAQLLVVRSETLGLEGQFAELNLDPVFRETYADRIADISRDAHLARLRSALDAQLRASDGAVPVFLGWYTSEAKLGRLRYAFDRLARAASEASVPVLVTIIPYLDEGNARAAYPLAYALVDHEAQRSGFEVLDLRDAFVRYGLERIRGRNPIHPNAEGHALIASELYDRLGQRFAR